MIDATFLLISCRRISFALSSFSILGYRLQARNAVFVIRLKNKKLKKECSNCPCFLSYTSKKIISLSPSSSLNSLISLSLSLCLYLSVSLFTFSLSLSLSHITLSLHICHHHVPTSLYIFPYSH